MDWLILWLEVAFMLPMAVRVLGRETPETTVFAELRSSFRAPWLLVHEIGLLLVWVGVGIEFWTGGIARRVTGRGVLGAVLHAAATLLIAWSILVFRSWRLLPAIDSGHELCMVGPYRFVRHPVYVALDLLGLGAAIWVPKPIVLTGALLMLVAGEGRARVEERVLTEAFGERYLAYMRRVARVIPGIY
jgi:protein-S-isoprenylcysteine O-methyltransferase Ste14